MTVALAASFPDPHRRAIKTEIKLFSDAPVLCARTSDGVYVLYDTIADIIGDTQALANLFGKCVLIIVPSGGKEEARRFVSRADFLGAAIISERNRPFRDFVVKLMEELEDKGFVCAPDLMNDPRMQQVAALATAMSAAIKAEREASEAKSLATEAMKVGLNADAKAEKAVKIASATEGEANAFPLVKWALTQGIVLDPEGDGRDEGILLAAEMRKAGICPRKVRTTSYPAGVNVYPERWLFWWKNDFTRRNPEIGRQLRKS